MEVSLIYAITMLARKCVNLCLRFNANIYMNSVFGEILITIAMFTGDDG